MGKKIKTAAICISRIFDMQNYGYIRNLNELLKAQGIHLLVYAISTDAYWEESIDHVEAHVFDIIPFRMIDVLIFMDEKIKSHRIAGKVIGAAQAQNVPVVVVDGRYKGCVSVCFDFEYGFEAVVRHMIEEHKCVRPHFMAGIKGNEFSEKRLAIFKKVIAENGIDYDESTMLSYGDFWAGPARTAMNGLLDRGIVPDCVICANDFMAINVAAVLKERGLKVPEQVKVSGFDGVDEARISDPDITTAECNCDVLAGKTADAVIKLIAKEEPEAEYLVIPEIIKGRSCGCGSSAIRATRLLNMVNDKSYRYQDDINDFYELTMRMQMSRSAEEMAKGIYGSKLSRMFIVVNGECLDTEHDYFRPQQGEERIAAPYLIYDHRDKGRIRKLEPEDMEKLTEENMSSGHPFIFNLLHYMHRPMGYVCFCLDDYDIYEYSKTSIISNYLGLGLGGFINQQYQKYLFGKVEEMYRYDQLTGLYNRMGFNYAFEKLQESLKGKEMPLTVIMADLDGLKIINDRYGHKAGDNAIAVSAAALRDACPEDALCMRFGGDEMCAFVCGVCDMKKIRKDIDGMLEEYNLTSGLEYKVHVSCGGYVSVMDADVDIDALLRSADQDMYLNKKAWKKEN